MTSGPIRFFIILFFLQESITMTMKSVVLLVCIFLTSSIKIAQASVTNCTSTPCDIKTCSNTSSKCYQICSVTPCKTECSSPSGCDAKCPIGGCSKMSCSITQRSPAVRVSTSFNSFHCSDKTYFPKLRQLYNYDKPTMPFPRSLCISNASALLSPSHL